MRDMQNQNNDVIRASKSNTENTHIG